MVKSLRLMLLLTAAALILAGCAAPARTSEIPGQSTAKASKHLPLKYADEVIMYCETDFNEYTYFLDMHDPRDNSSERGYDLCRQSKDTGAIESLGIIASDIHVFGENLYIDVCIPFEQGLYLFHWQTYIIQPDGTGKRLIGQDVTMQEYENSLYYTVYGESAIFRAGLDCTDAVRIPLLPPEGENPMNVLSLTAKGKLMPVVTLYSIEDGWINAAYDIVNEKGQSHYSVLYSISVSEHKERAERPGEYYDNRIAAGSRLYYLDLENPVENTYSEEPLFSIHSMNENGSGDSDLNILCCCFDIIGKNIYADTYIISGDFRHWETYRYDLDGTGEKKLEYADMRRFAGEERLYFSQFDECAFYSADFACKNVKRYDVLIPDEAQLRADIGEDYDYSFVTVTGENDGWVYFEFEVTDTGRVAYYTGNYRMDLKSGKTEKAGEGDYSTPDAG